MASKRKVYHVVNEGGMWKAKVERDERASVTGTIKREVIEVAKTLAQRSELGQVIIHREDGSIEEECTYGEDPRNTMG